VPQQLKWDPAARSEIIARYERLSAPHLGVDVLFWPEAALPVFAARAPGLLARLERSLAEAGGALVLGIPDLTPDPAAPDRLRFLNTAQVLGAGSGRYVKHHLVPFGEYVPLEGLLRGLIGFLDLPMSRALPGPAAQPALTAAGQRWATPICYEVVFPSLVRDLARDATVLATLSNDAWFGDSLGPEQHHQMARFRARELGRPMARVTNDGVTALINAQGEETARLPRFRAAVLTGTVQPQRGLTPYARFGDGPLWALALGLLGLALRGHRRDV
jgi:apolipoprotein N-acyltransferase